MYAVAEPRLSPASPVPRDDHWLGAQLDHVWSTFFSDIPCVNVVEVSFARYWRARLGLIAFREATGETYIGINSYLRYSDVPEFVLTTILAHEIAHYAHGFGSPLPRKFRHPHQGGVVLKELAARGLAGTYRAHQHWIHEHWQRICCKPRLHAVR